MVESDPPTLGAQPRRTPPEGQEETNRGRGRGQGRGQERGQRRGQGRGQGRDPVERRIVQVAGDRGRGQERGQRRGQGRGQGRDQGRGRNRELQVEEEIRVQAEVIEGTNNEPVPINNEPQPTIEDIPTPQLD